MISQSRIWGEKGASRDEWGTSDPELGVGQLGVNVHPPLTSQRNPGWTPALHTWERGWDWHPWGAHVSVLQLARLKLGTGRHRAEPKWGLVHACGPSRGAAGGCPVRGTSEGGSSPLRGWRNARLMLLAMTLGRLLNSFLPLLMCKMGTMRAPSPEALVRKRRCCPVSLSERHVPISASVPVRQVAQSTVPFPRWENRGSESPSNWFKVTELEVNESTGTQCLPASESRCGAAGSGTCRQRCVWARGLPTTKAPA